MRNTIKSTLYGFLFSVGLFVSACSGSGDSDLVDVIDSDSGDALVSDEYSPIRITDRGVAPSKNAAELVDAGELDAGDAAELLDVGELDANDGGDASVDAAELLDVGELDANDGGDASVDAAELLDAGELDANDGGDASVDAAELLDAGELDANDGAGELVDDGAGELVDDGAGELVDAGNGCNVVGTWHVDVTPDIYCFRVDTGFMLDLAAQPGCSTDLEISLDLVDTWYGHFVGSITYHLSFDGDSVSGTAIISGTVILSDTVSGPCTAHATVIGVRL